MKTIITRLVFLVLAVIFGEAILLIAKTFLYDIAKTELTLNAVNGGQLAAETARQASSMLTIIRFFFIFGYVAFAGFLFVPVVAGLNKNNQ